MRYISTRHGSQGKPEPLGFEEIMLAGLARDGGLYLPTEWPRMTYAEAMRRYGSDKPDLRFGMELINLSEWLKGTDFAPFADTLAKGGEIKCIVAKGKAE